ncbi:uncharacterized protein LOC133796408 [Humulus lupulus]|uniref:uncharacterized protein LOC133796408 n=1 Tax=Humulus lupulus TaxID=3486 RepID=UPI002B40EF9C|nr:uncharacterized protein LOC133796408 [Humulus lupulus]
MLAATASTTASKLYCSSSDHWRLRTPNKAMASTKLAPLPLPFSRHSFETTPKGSSFVRALKEEKDTNDSAFASKEDLAYLGRLATGSIVGAGVIKYGSVVFPDITRPNLTEALFIILSPVIIAVLLLINQSRKEEPS